MSTTPRNRTTKPTATTEDATQGIKHLIRHVEALIFASAEPVSAKKLQQLLMQVMVEPVEAEVLEATVQALQAEYQHSALELAETVTGYQFRVKTDFASTIATAWPDRPVKLSQTLLETLSVVAYYQPVTRGDIEQIRGVAVNPTILKNLFERGWITENGFRDTPGKPALLVTTTAFLHAFNLRSLDDLPQKPTVQKTSDQLQLDADLLTPLHTTPS